jgi:hypothetical protein
MTLSTYTHVIRELRGAESLPMEEQIRRAREPGARSAGDGVSLPADAASSEAHIVSRVSSVCPEGEEAGR